MLTLELSQRALSWHMRLGTLVVTAQVTFGNESSRSLSGRPGSGIMCILQLLQVSQVVCKMKQSDFQRICTKSAASGVATVETVCCKFV